MKANPFRYFKTSPEIIRLAVMLLECSVIGSESAGAFIEERFS